VNEMAGYNWHAGKSNNAVAAEAEGLVVKSKLTASWLKAHGIEETVGFIKFLIQAGKICPTEWHHTSKFFNRTDYYSAEEIIETLELMETSGHLQTWRDMFKVPEIRRETNYLLLGNEFLRRLNGKDMFGHTEPFYQRSQA
jgi:hypothetical protein